VPVLSWTRADLREHGPVLTVAVSPVRAAADAMRAAGQTVPPPVTVPGLIDTGAFRTGIDRGIASRLGLRPAGIALISTPTSAAGVPVLTYAVQLALPGGVTFARVTAVEASIAGDGLGILIGRDVLASAVLVYVGTTGQCTLSF
jgi:hypothetical protein